MKKILNASKCSFSEFFYEFLEHASDMLNIQFSTVNLRDIDKTLCDKVHSINENFSNTDIDIILFELLQLGESKFGLIIIDEPSPEVAFRLGSIAHMFKTPIIVNKEKNFYVL